MYNEGFIIKDPFVIDMLIGKILRKYLKTLRGHATAKQEWHR